MKNLVTLLIMCLCFFTGCKAQSKVDNSEVDLGGAGIKDYDI